MNCVYFVALEEIRELKKTNVACRYLRQRKRYLKVNNCATYLSGRYFLLLAVYIVDKVRYKWTNKSAVGVIIRDERFTNGFSRCR